MKNKKYTSVHHILKYIGVFGSVEVLKTLASLSRGKITAYFLGTFGAGLIAIYQNIIDIVRSFTNIGLEVASIQQLSEIDATTQKDEIQAMSKVIRTWSLAVATLNIIVCCVVATFASNLFFNDNCNHHSEILTLVPAVFLMPIAAGECAILKGTHKLKRVATVELLGALGTVVCSFSVYWLLGLKGIILALSICIAIETFVHLFFCNQIMPYRIAPFTKETWKRGIPLLKFGIPYAVTAIMGAMTTTILYNIITSTNEVGLYKTGYALIIYYVSIVFSSNAIDYFPRLTAACHDTALKNETVNKQIHVSFTLTTPLVMAFILALPLIILVLYTEDFMPMASICVMAGLFQLHRSVALPLEYVSLAHGHSWIFLILESLYNMLIVVAAYLLYNTWGVPGIGMALSLVGLANTAILGMVNYLFYNITISIRNWYTIATGSCLVVAVIILCNTGNSFLRMGVGIPLTLLTAIYSYITLRKGIKDEA